MRPAKTQRIVIFYCQVALITALFTLGLVFLAVGDSMFAHCDAGSRCEGAPSLIASDALEIEKAFGQKQFSGKVVTGCCAEEQVLSKTCCFIESRVGTSAVKPSTFKFDFSFLALFIATLLLLPTVIKSRAYLFRPSLRTPIGIPLFRQKTSFLC